VQVNLQKAVLILREDGVVGIPTETVYGLAARIDSESALRQIFATKERPFFDPLIVHVSSLEQARGLVSWWPEVATVLAQRFWPGPLTLVLPKAEQVNPLITSGLPTVALRQPRHPLTQQLLEKVGPLAAPSANKFGRVSPTRPEHVEGEFSGQVAVLDGGSCEVGIESTVLLVKNSNPVQISILREGQILLSEIEKEMTEAKLPFTTVAAVSRAESPGHFRHHYMPSVPLVLCERIPRCQEHLQVALAEKISQIPEQVEGVRVRKPSSLQNLRELVLATDPVLAARELYQRLREVAETSPDVIYFVVPSCCIFRS